MDCAFRSSDTVQSPCTSLRLLAICLLLFTDPTGTRFSGIRYLRFCHFTQLCSSLHFVSCYCWSDRECFSCHLFSALTRKVRFGTVQSLHPTLRLFALCLLLLTDPSGDCPSHNPLNPLNLPYHLGLISWSRIRFSHSTQLCASFHFVSCF